MLHRRLLVTTVVLGHEKGPVSIATGEGFSHELFRSSLVIFPGVIQEADTIVNSSSDQSNGAIVIPDGANVISSQSKDRYVYSGAAQRTLRNIRLIGRSQQATRRIECAESISRVLDEIPSVRQLFSRRFIPFNRCSTGNSLIAAGPVCR